MIVLGLTGSIGMGKSTVAGLLRRRGVPMWNADAAVHRLYARGGGAVPKVAALEPEAIVDGAVDRTRLAHAVLRTPGLLAKLEAAVHPLVQQDEQRFVRLHRQRRTPLVGLDVPLLLEGRAWQRRVQVVLVVSAPAFIQRQRVLARPGMTVAKLAAISARQMPDLVKRRLADYVLPTGGGRALTWRRLGHILADLRANKHQRSSGQHRCAKSFWIRKQPVSTRPKGIG